MAGIWTDTIEVVGDVAQKRIRVTATRTDDVTGRTWTGSVTGQIDLQNLAASRDRIADTLYARYEAEQTLAAIIASYIDAWEPAVAAALQAKEAD